MKELPMAALLPPQHPSFFVHPLQNLANPSSRWGVRHDPVTQRQGGRI
jgi:hypothetical protein